MSGSATSGFWLTRSLDSAISPRPISVMMMTTAATGRLMLKSERNMASSSRSGTERGGGRRRRVRRLRQFHLLPVDQGRAGGAQQLVAGRDAGGDDDLAAARVALAERDRGLRDLAALDAPDEGLVALLRDRRLGQQQRLRFAGGDAALGIEVGGLRRGAGREVDDHRDLARHLVGRGVDMAHLAGELALAVAVDAEQHGLADADVAQAVGRDEALEAHAGGVDDLEQLLADGGGVAGRDLAVADDAVE